MKSIGRRGFLKHLVATASLALVPTMNLLGAEQEPRYNRGSELNNTPTYEEIISAGSESKIKRSLQYTIPKFLDGDYQLWFEVKTDKGELMVFFPIRDLSLKSSEGSLSLGEEFCYLKIMDVNGVFSLLQGVSVAKEEKLIFVCSIKNNYGRKISFIPMFETFYRNLFGEKVDSMLDDDQTIMINENEEKEIELIIPKQSIPQAYDIKLSFLETNLKLNSNNVIIHYVLHGLSASIHSLQINKANFVVGEEADVNVYWTPSADSFEDSRLSTEFKDGKAVLKLFENNSLCAQKEVSLLNEERFSTKLKLEQNCNATKLQVSLLDSYGKELDKSDLNLLIEKEVEEEYLETVFEELEIPQELIDSGLGDINDFDFGKSQIKFDFINIIILVIIIVVVVIGIIFMKKRFVK